MNNRSKVALIFSNIVRIIMYMGVTLYEESKDLIYAFQNGFSSLNYRYFRTRSPNPTLGHIYAQFCFCFYGGAGGGALWP